MSKTDSAAHARAIAIAFLVVTTTFLASTLYADHVASAERDQVERMRRTNLPRFEIINELRRELRHVEVFADRLLDVTGRDADDAEAALTEARERFASANRRFESLAPAPEDVPVRAEIAQRVADLDAATTRVIATDRATLLGERALLVHDIEDGADRIEALLQSAADGNVARARLAIDAMDDARQAARRTAFLFDLLAALLGACATLHVFRTLRRYRELVAAHDRLLEQRASELEAFAARVAHDVLTPLTAASFALQFAERHTIDRPEARQVFASGRSAVMRARAVVDALYEFARSGGAPLERGPTRVRPAMEALIGETRLARDARIEVEPFEDAAVSCSAGVLSSVLSNLVENAVRHADACSRREVHLRAVAREQVVRCEVEDDGPGVEPASRDLIFLPHVRGAAGDAGGQGLGLGLATVRRLVEAHGGRVGVRPATERGSVFWFELPRA